MQTKANYGFFSSTLLNGDTVAFRVESPADLLQFAVPLHLRNCKGTRATLRRRPLAEFPPPHLVLNGGGLHEEGVFSVAGEHAIHTRLVRVHHDVVSASLHHAAHLGEDFIIRLLRS